ncbi:Hypothetical predicted protein [Marmota monax]|uniref:Uncharacterized protein n=1 Tax=Marmota monax TaxID=9995 RepID=A0A5E4B9L6_MARMO|nr:Hypothetical predicted protein [Marmota monax]
MILCLLPGQVLLTLPAREGKPCVIAVEARHECGFVPPGLGASTCHSGSQRCQGEPGCGLETRAGGVGAARGECSGVPGRGLLWARSPPRRPQRSNRPRLHPWLRPLALPSSAPGRRPHLLGRPGFPGPGSASEQHHGRRARRQHRSASWRLRSVPGASQRAAPPPLTSASRTAAAGACAPGAGRSPVVGTESWSTQRGSLRSLRLSEVNAQTPGAEAEAPEVPAASRQCGCQRAALC